MNPLKKNLIQMVGSLLLFILCAITYFWVVEFREEDRETYTSQFWVPLNSTVFTEKSDWESMLPKDKTYLDIYFTTYKENLSEEKSIIFINDQQATYASVHGKIVLCSRTGFADSPPPTTNIQEFKYLQNGVVEWRVERSLRKEMMFASLVGFFIGSLIWCATVMIVMIFGAIFGSIFQKYWTNRKNHMRPDSSTS